MGTVFGFVSKDLKSKIDILSEQLREDNTNFETARKMIEYEKSNNLLYKNGYTSGSRTLLRLHRGLGKKPFEMIFEPRMHNLNYQ